MRFLHLSDLHLGKRVNEFSMLEDQAYILKEILNIIDEQKVEAVLIAGDVYDKVIPPAEAVRLLDDFLTRLAARELPVFLISGNHDSAERVAFGSRLMSSRQIYLSPVFESDVEPITISDRYGEINIYMLPFVKPSLVKRVYPEEEIITYKDAVNVINDKKFNINEDFDILLKKKNETDDDAYTTKNTLIQLNYDKNDIIRNLKELKISEYIETLTDVKNVYSPQFWVFIKRINLKQVYIKVKIRSIQNRKIFCISFHFARFQVNNFPYG